MCGERKNLKADVDADAHAHDHLRSLSASFSLHPVPYSLVFFHAQITPNFPSGFSREIAGDYVKK
jgi:hypothetical protein